MLVQEWKGRYSLIRELLTAAMVVTVSLCGGSSPRDACAEPAVPTQPLDEARRCESRILAVWDGLEMEPYLTPRKDGVGVPWFGELNQGAVLAEHGRYAPLVGANLATGGG